VKVKRRAFATTLYEICYSRGMDRDPMKKDPKMLLEMTPCLETQKVIALSEFSNQCSVFSLGELEPESLCLLPVLYLWCRHLHTHTKHRNFVLFGSLRN